MNGEWIGTYPAGASREVLLRGPFDPPLDLELRSPSDAVLLELGVNNGQIEQATAGGHATGDSVGLPCGVLSVVVGTLRANEVPAPPPSVAPGPCP